MIVCPRCRRPATTSPCLDCKRRLNRSRGSAASRGYDAAWQALSRRAIRAQPWCTTCGATTDLTADHKVPLAAGGKRTGLTLTDVEVLCRPCNSRKGARRDPGDGLPPPAQGPPGRHSASYSDEPDDPAGAA